MRDPTFADLFAALVRGWWVIVALALGGGVAAFAAASLMTPLYRSEVTMMPAGGAAQGAGLAALAAQFGGLAGLSGLQLSGPVDRMEALEVLRSRSLALEFIRANDLARELFPDRWDAATRSWIADEGGEPSDAALANRFVTKVCRVSNDNRTGLVTVAMTWRDGAQTARWANSYADLANQTLRRQALERAQSNLAYLNEELDKTQVLDVREAIYRLIEAQMQTKMIATVEPEFAFRVVDSAVVPDPNDVVSPRRGILALVGIAIGGALGVLLAWRLWRGRQARPPSAA